MNWVISFIEYFGSEKVVYTLQNWRLIISQEQFHRIILLILYTTDESSNLFC